MFHRFMRWQGVIALLVLAVGVAGSTGGAQAAPLHGGGSMEPDFASELRPIVLKTMEELRVPGVIIGVWRGDEAWVAAFGVGNLVTGEAMRRGNHMRIGSITKTFTGTVLLQLVDEGKIALDDPIAKYIPGIPNGDKITVRMLGDMTSGLFSYDGDMELAEAVEANPYETYRPEELVQIGIRNPAYFAPGEGWHYSNTNTILLGMLIEQLTGQSLGEVYRERIFAPLGMRETYLSTDGSLALPHARGYNYVSLLIPKAVAPDAPAQDVTNYNPSWAWAAGAIVSTVDDMRPFARALVTGQLTSASAHAERLKWRGEGLPYGFAILNYHGLLGHNGQIHGYQSFMVHDPDRDLTVIILANIDAATNDAEPADQLLIRLVPLLQAE